MRLPRKWALSLGLLAAAPTLVSAGPFSRSAEPAAKPAGSANQDVADAVKAALQTARPKGKGIQIEVRSGVATVSGSISDAAEKARVSQVVSRVPGVASVDNRLVLMTAAAPRAASGVEQAGFAGERRGPIQTVSHEEAAEPMARGQQIRQVSEEYAAPAPVGNNQQIAQQIADNLASCGLQDYNVEVRFKNGNCSLIGQVEAREQAIAADRAARSVPGVQNVINKLTVGGQPALPAAPRGPVAPAGYPGAAPAGYPGAGPGGYPGMAPGGYPGAGMPPHGPMGPMGPQGPMMGPQGPMGPMGPGGPMGPQGIQQAQGQYPPGAMMTPPTGVQPAGHHMMYNQPHVPENAWPAYAQYDNYAAVTYPSQYDASAWPYIGPFYPYPQVPLNWRQATLEWDDGAWSLRFSPKTDKWWWFMNPHNWH
jgi:osmotically-inducible protein OsmY